MSELLDQEEAEHLVAEVCEVVGSELADHVRTYYGSKAYKPFVRTESLQFMRQYLPRTMHECGFFLNDAAVESSIVLAMESFDRRLKHLRSTSGRGGTA